MTLNSANRTRLEKAASDNGFDLDLGCDGHWLVFGSSQAKLNLWLSASGQHSFLLAFSRLDVSEALVGLCHSSTSPVPNGAVAVSSVSELSALHHLVRRSFQLARALPDEPLKAFIDKTAGLFGGTEAERLVVQRVGQAVFRERLVDYWEGQCAITGLSVCDLLRASHIKPWADCESDAERLDVFNGLLLAPQLDAVFDRGFITVEPDGSVIVSDALDSTARLQLALASPLRIVKLTESHRKYLLWHRERVFRGAVQKFL